MTLETTPSEVRYNGNDVTLQFATTFKFLNNVDIVVNLIDANGVATLQTEGGGGDYTLSGAGVGAGGTVTMSVAPPTGEVLWIRRDSTLKQSLDLVENDGFPADDFEKALDAQVAKIQEVDQILDRAVGLQSVEAPLNMDLPLFDERKGKIMTFDEVTSQPIPGVSNAILDGLIASFDTAGLVGTAAALKSVLSSSLTDGEFLSVTGYFAPGDTGLFITYKWDASSTATDDGGSVFIPDDTPATGRWLVQIKGPVSIRMFGADPSLVDNKPAIQAALDAYLDVYMPEGTFIILSALFPRSNQNITLSMGCTIKLGSDGGTCFHMRDAAFKENITIDGGIIDGGGQTTDIFSGVKAGRGVDIKNATNVTVKNQVWRNMGVVKSVGDPKDDANFGGFGILIRADLGVVENILIQNCRAVNIAGGGANTGDGFYTGGQNPVTTVTQNGVIFDNCFAITVGRHGFTLAGTASVPQSISKWVTINNCHAENTALSGIDFESGERITVNNFIGIKCGNDQTYFDPLVEYAGFTRLIAGIAVGNDEQDLQITNFNLDGCHQGITAGASTGVHFANGKITNSVANDYTNAGLAQPPSGSFTNVEFLSSLTFNLNVTRADDLGMYYNNCIFKGNVDIRGKEQYFIGCTFDDGVQTNGNFAQTGRLSFDSCRWNPRVGIGLKFGTSDNTLHTSVTNCRFYGGNQMSNGIDISYLSTLDLKVTDSEFYDLTGQGIHGTSQQGKRIIDRCTGNHFHGCANGIDIDDGSGQSVIADNTFKNITGWCIIFDGITGNAFTDTNIIGNISGAGVANGIKIEKTGGGSFDWIIVKNNNMRSVTTTSFSFTGGQNVNGIVADNIDNI